MWTYTRIFPRGPKHQQLLIMHCLWGVAESWVLSLTLCLYGVGENLPLLLLQIIIVLSCLFLGERRYGIGGDDSTSQRQELLCAAPGQSCVRGSNTAQLGSACSPSSLLRYKGSSTIVTCSENTEWPRTGLHCHCCCCCHGA